MVHVTGCTPGIPGRARVTNAIVAELKSYPLAKWRHLPGGGEKNPNLNSSLE